MLLRIDYCSIFVINGASFSALFIISSLYGFVSPFMSSILSNCLSCSSSCIDSVLIISPDFVLYIYMYIYVCV